MSAAAARTSLLPVGLPDVQAEPPAIPLPLDEAGISDLRYPITVQLSDGTEQSTVATVVLAAGVHANTRGVHMSRFVELLHEWHHRIGAATLPALLDELTQRLNAASALARFSFPLFMERTAPITGAPGYVPYDCELEGTTGPEGTHLRLTVRVPVKSLCPCSREISDYGAHNQRGVVEISIESGARWGVTPLELSELISVAESAGSSQIYSVLKRPDERFITMRAYENAAFVEDITRTVADVLRGDERIRRGSVRVVNEESIHSHNAYAAVQWTR